MGKWAVVLASVFIVSIATLVITTVPVTAHFPGVSLTGFGTPTIDGVLSAGEWDGAGQISVFTGAFAGSTFFVMNDANNLYLALEVVDSTFNPGDTMIVRFDNTHDGVNTDGDDGIFAGQTNFRDTRFLTCCGYGLVDTLQHGTSDAGSTGSKNFIEASKPLNSGDSNDFSLSLGDTVGFCLAYAKEGFGPGSSSIFPAGLGVGCRGSQQSLYGDIIIASPVVSVDIDIKPRSDPNSINPKSGGAVPVAILGSDTFDVTDVDVITLAFGPSGATPKHDLTDPTVYASHLEDVNGDGFTDLVSHYVQKETGLLSSDIEACITGQTTDGTAIEGCDSVRVK